MSKATDSVKTSGWIFLILFYMEQAYANVAKHTSVISSGGELGLFWCSQNAPVTPHVRYSSCKFLTVNLQAVIRLHASRQEKKSLLPAVTLGVRDKERSSNQPVSRFTTERSLLLLCTNISSLLPFVFKKCSRCGTEQDLSLTSLSISDSSTKPAWLQCWEQITSYAAETTRLKRCRRNTQRKLQSRFWHKICIFLTRNIEPGEIISHISCFSSLTTFTISIYSMLNSC